MTIEPFPAPSPVRASAIIAEVPLPALRRRGAWRGVLLLALSIGGCSAQRVVQPATASLPSQPSTSVTAAEAPLPVSRHGKPLAIVTGSERETDLQIGRDLARYVAAPAGLDLDVRTSRGATDNLHRLRDDASVDLAIVQYDVIQAFVDQAAHGNGAAAHIADPLRVIAPLYTQELYFIARKDSDLQSVGQLRGRRINVGVVGSGSALTVAALYRRLFDTPMAVGKATYLDDQKALAALTIDRSIDAMVIVAGQPTKLLAAMRPEASAFIKLLPIDAREASTRAAFRDYFPATILRSSYPQWLDRDVPTLSVMSFLVTMTGKGAEVDDAVARLTRSLCQNIGALRREGHPKWREVDVSLRIAAPGWKFASGSADALARCPVDRRSTASSALP